MNSPVDNPPLVATSARPQRIAQILEDRRPFATKANKLATQLSSVSQALENLSTFLPEVKERDIPDESRDKIVRLQSRIPKIQVDISEQKAELQQLGLRFSRNTLNVGIVGNARQGKSTFLQALTGLTSEEIPSAETDHCTGAPSLIINHNETYADIQYFTKSEFLKDIIAPFYTQLSLTPQPPSFDSFVSNPLATPSEKMSATDQALYDKLKFRHGSANEYQSFLGKAEDRVAKSEIRSHIAQQDLAGEKLAKWLAVKMATVYCPFAVSDAGRISVCDTPGLGDFVCGAEDSLVQNIGMNLDTVLMLKRTPKGGIATPEDTQLYDLLPKAVSELDPKDWSYFIVNRDGSENETKSFESQIKEKIQCRDFITLDARQQDEVLSSFDKILEDVAENQQHLDSTLSNSRFEKLEALSERITMVVDEAKSALPKSVGTDGIGMKELLTLFNPVWDNVANELNNLTTSYRANRDKSGKLNRQVDEINTNVLLDERKRLEQIEPKDFAGQEVSLFTSELFHELRLTVATAFDKLDDDFVESIDTLRDEVCRIFWETGKLADIFDQGDPQEWLLELAETIKSLDDGDEIAEVIKRFANTGFTFRGYLLAKVRGTLNPLDEKEKASVHYRYEIGNDWERVREKLWSACNVAVSDCADVVKGLSVDKNGALFSCNEQFTDGVLRLGGWNRARLLWANLYDEYKTQVWVDRFANIEVNKAMRRDWDARISDLENALNSLTTL